MGKVKTTKKVALVADKVVGGVLKNTVGRVARFAGRRLLGRIPDAAIEGSYQEEKPREDAVAPEPVIINAVEEIAEAIVAETADITSIPDSEKAALMEEVSDQIFTMKSDQELIEAAMSVKEGNLEEDEMLAEILKKAKDAPSVQ